MNPILQSVIIDTVESYYKKKDPKNYKRNIRIEARDELLDFVYILLGVLSASFGLAGIIIPNDFIDGGVTGISLILNEITGFDVSLGIVLINLPFIILAFTSIGRRFAVKSIIGITLFALAVHYIHYPVLTNDKILAAAFGGFFLGLGIGLAIRGGSILDGTEVLAIFISRKSGLSVGNIIMLFNILIFCAGAYFLSVETALYAIITYFAASKTVDFVIDGIEEYIGVTIISEKNEEIRKSIVDNMKLGCTIYKGQNGYSGEGESLKDINIVFTVITRLEMSKLHTEISKVDEKAFVIMNSIKDTKGGVLKAKPLAKIH